MYPFLECHFLKYHFSMNYFDKTDYPIIAFPAKKRKELS